MTSAHGRALKPEYPAPVVRPPMKTFGAVVARVVVGKIKLAVPAALRNLSAEDLERIEGIISEEAERIERLGPPVKPKGGRPKKVGRD